jgi:GT2 family glycosyltransferase/glycosyltransferase involved in cell wall biosynthesis
MEQQTAPDSLHDTNTNALLPLLTEYDARADSYTIRNGRSSSALPALHVRIDNETPRHWKMTLFSALYSHLGRFGPVVIRALTLLLHRVLNLSVIPAEIREIARFPDLFDRTYYRQQLLDAQQQIPSDLLYHYITIGDAHNICPNPLFDPAIYRRHNMRAHEATQNTLAHYISGEWDGNGVTSYFFHSRWYLEQYPDLAQAGVQPLHHYLTVGSREHRAPSFFVHMLNYGESDLPMTQGQEPTRTFMSGGDLQYEHDDEKQNILADMPFPYTVAKEFQHFATYAGNPLLPLQLQQQADVLAEMLANCGTIQTDNPRVSVIIPVYNQLTHTIAAVQSILVSHSTVPFEIIIVDDCSTDNTVVFFAQFPRIRIYSQVTNQGFIDACNQGATLARSEFLLFLNNDVYVLPQWLDTLVATFDTCPNAGLVGSQLLFPDGLLQEAGGIIWASGEAWNYGRGDYPMRPEYNYMRSVDYCSGASILIRATLFHTLGMFATAFKPAYYEDADLAMAVREAGYDVVYQPASKVVHFEGVSSGRDIRTGVKAHQTRNQLLFADKWKSRLKNRRSYGDNPHLEALHWSGERVVFADLTYPTPDQDAGSVVADNWMRMLRVMGYHVTFIPVDTFVGIPKYTKRLEALGVYCPRHPYETDVRSFFAATVHAYTFGVFHLYDRARRVYDILDALHIHMPRIFIPSDLHYLRGMRHASITGSIPEMVQSLKTKYDEYLVMSESTLTIMHSHHERDEIHATLPQLDVEVVPIMYDVPGRNSAFQDRADIMFIGGFRHPPNVDGIVFFCTDVWPIVQQQLPGIKLSIVGPNVTPAVTALASPTVDVLGFVQDLDPLFASIRLTIAPLRYGAGVKGKVTMSLCNGIPVVGTSVAFEGMSLTNGREVLEADTAQGLADHIVTVYRDEQLWYRLSEAAVAHAKAEYSIEANKPLFERIVANVIRTRTKPLRGTIL